MKNAALSVAGLIFLAVSAIHFFRFYKHFEIVIANHNIPAQWSIYGGAITLLLAIWMFIAASK